MPELIRMRITDNISKRYARSRVVVYSVVAVCFVAFITLVTTMRPSFPFFLAVSAFFSIGLLVCIMRNPLGILTMRTQLKIAAREVVFEPQGLTLILLSGHGANFKTPKAELVFLPGPGGCDYYLIVKGENGETGSCYVGNDLGEIERLAGLLEEIGALEKFERQPNPQSMNIKSHTDQFFS